MDYKEIYQNDELRSTSLDLIIEIFENKYESIKGRLSPDLQKVVAEILEIYQLGKDEEFMRNHAMDWKILFDDLDEAVIKVSDGFINYEANIIDCWARAKDLKKLETN